MIYIYIASWLWMVRIRGILPSNCCGDGSILIQTSPSARGSSWKLIGVKKKGSWKHPPKPRCFPHEWGMNIHTYKVLTRTRVKILRMSCERSMSMSCFGSSEPFQIWYDVPAGVLWMLVVMDVSRAACPRNISIHQLHGLLEIAQGSHQMWIDVLLLS